MSMVNKYRVWCETEAAYVYVWSESPPTQCPNDTGHAIDADSVVSIESVGSAQAYTPDGAAIIAKKDSAELLGNSVVMKRFDAELAPEAGTTKDWTIPVGKAWHMRLFSASVMSHAAEARLEYWRTPAAATTTAPVTTTTAPPDPVRVNPFDDDLDEPIAVLKLNGNSDSVSFYESLPLVGDGESFIRIVLVNKDALDSMEMSAYFNGYETDAPA